MHTSYSSLGKEFKGIFEDLVKHINSQKLEAEELRKNICAATTATSADEQAVSERLETCLSEEREKSRQEKQDLLAQITILVNKSSDAQEARWSSQISSVRQDIASSRSRLHTSEKAYVEGMDKWSNKETSFVDDVLKSRETLKMKMKEDWRAINEHNNSIQATTKSVHEETIRIVDAQMEDMSKQMRALDDFVTRARSQNERHHRTHIESLQSLASNVGQSYSNIGDHFISTYDRVRDVGKDISTQSSAAQASLEPLDSSLKLPLQQLREHITNTPIQEYQSTGETPRKVTYEYPTGLPRTDSHDKLLGRGAPIPPTVATSPNRSPSKQHIYTDIPDSEPGSTSPSKSSEPSTNTGLREISLSVNNVGLNRMNSDSAAITTLSSSIMKGDGEGIGMAPPPLKRQATESKLPMKLRGGGGVVKIEGRENLGASFGSGGNARRLRSSPVE